MAFVVSKKLGCPLLMRDHSAKACERGFPNEFSEGAITKLFLCAILVVRDLELGTAAEDVDGVPSVA